MNKSKKSKKTIMTPVNWGQIDNRVELTKTKITHFDVANPNVNMYIKLRDLNLNEVHTFVEGFFVNNNAPNTLGLHPAARRIGCCYFSEKDWKKIERAVKAAKKPKARAAKA